MKNIIFILFATIFFYGCKGKPTTEQSSAVEKADNHDEHENGNTANLSAEQIKSIRIEFGKIEKKQLTATLKANGILKVPNQNRANVTTLYGGVIQNILVQTGSAVKKGQVIATIANQSFISMQEEFISISAKTDLAQTEVNRQKELQQGNAGALKNLQSIETEFKTLNARKSSLQKQLELIGINADKLKSENFSSVINITSPINGIVSNIFVNMGSYTDGNLPIAEIIDNSQLHVDLYVYEKDLQKLEVNQTIHFTLTNNSGKEYDANIYAISNSFEQNTKAIAVHAKVRGDKQGLIDGMNITALVSLENATVDAVPTSSIVNHEGQDYIFIVTDEHAEKEHHQDTDVEDKGHDEHGHDHHEAEESKNEGGVVFEKVPVKKGTSDVGYSEITLLKEIPSNSKIVTNGAFFILAKMNNKGEAHQH